MEIYSDYGRMSEIAEQHKGSRAWENCGCCQLHYLWEYSQGGACTIYIYIHPYGALFSVHSYENKEMVVSAEGAPQNGHPCASASRTELPLSLVTNGCKLGFQDNTYWIEFSFRHFEHLFGFVRGGSRIQFGRAKVTGLADVECKKYLTTAFGG